MEGRSFSANQISWTHCTSLDQVLETWGLETSLPECTYNIVERRGERRGGGGVFEQVNERCMYMYMYMFLNER